MSRYRQNIQRKISNPTKDNAMDEYGITPREIKTDKKELKSKSKSKKDILIAKNKKLPQSFTASCNNQQEKMSPKRRQEKSRKKSGQFFQIWEKNFIESQYEGNGPNGMKTSHFGFNTKINKNANQVESTDRIVIQPYTYFSERVEAFELRQRLKKSTSMKNLIEQRFIPGNEKSQFQNENYFCSQTPKMYDSTKYNWRLSKSKQKHQKQKSLSALSYKSILLSDAQKIQKNQNKLTLNIQKDANNENILKLKSHSILSYEYNPQKEALKNSIKKRNPQNSIENLSYTFGSDVMNNLYFS